LLLAAFAAYLKQNPNSKSFHVVVQEDTGEEGAMLQAAEPVVAPQAEIVEPGGMAAHSVGRSDATRFTHFLDGAQRSRRIGFYRDTVPLVYGFIGAVVRRRGDDRRMHTSDKLFRENLYFSFNHLDPSELRQAGIEPRNANHKHNGDSEEAEIHPLRLLQMAQQTVSNDRAELEKLLAEKWMLTSSNDEWLLWDGSITSSTEAVKHPRMVGVIKSHQTQYFGAEEQRKILALKPGERSSVFRPRIKDWTPVYSWYLRLHPNDGRDIYFGLVRIEAAARPETIEKADEISCWLMRERAPLSLPDARWDRMIYPIRDCEQYLKSIAPSNVMIEAALAGV
jgi:hypothetical protein